MQLHKIVKNILYEHLNEDKQLTLESWFHGTPDAREIEKEGGFTHSIIEVEYVKDPNGFKELRDKINKAKVENNEELYWKLLDKVATLKSTFKYKKPLFLTDEYSVAKTYADPRRAFDYQSAVDKVYEVDVNCNNIVKIIAIGDRFRFISEDKVKKGFIEAGISDEEISKVIAMFNFYVSDNKGIKTDTIAALGNWFNFDCIDVIGVLDSYHGGTKKSTVRMVLDPTNVKIKNI